MHKVKEIQPLDFVPLNLKTPTPFTHADATRMKLSAKLISKVFEKMKSDLNATDESIQVLDNTTKGLYKNVESLNERDVELGKNADILTQTLNSFKESTIDTFTLIGENAGQAFSITSNATLDMSITANDTALLGADNSSMILPGTDGNQ